MIEKDMQIKELYDLKHMKNHIFQAIFAIVNKPVTFCKYLQKSKCIYLGKFMNIDESCLAANVLSKNCPSRVTLMHLTNRWGVLVMFSLRKGTHRFSELRRRIDGISEKMLTQTLRDLENDGFIVRKEYAVIP